MDHIPASCQYAAGPADSPEHLCTWSQHSSLHPPSPLFVCRKRNILIFIWPLNLKFQPLRQNIQCSCVISRYWYSCIYQWKMKEMKFNFLFKQMEKSMKNIQCSAYEYNISTGNRLQTWLSILNCLDFQIYGRLSKSFILALRWIRCILWIVILKNDDKGRLWPCMN